MSAAWYESRQRSSFALILLLFYHDACPAVFVGFDAVLDVAKLLIEFAADGTWLAVLRDDVALLGVEVVDALDGADDGCCAASSGLFEGGKLFFGNLTTLYLLLFGVT